MNVKKKGISEKGFWSITAYGDDDFLIENPIDRYSVSDRTAFEKNDDGSEKRDITLR